jgi:oligoendopeptidase F
VTKVKAFGELDKYLSTVDVNDEELIHILTFFLYHFCRIILNEPDKKVREAAHTTFSAFIRKCKKKLGPHLNKIFSLWVCSFFDPSAEVSALAKNNFDAAFPEKNQD